MFYFSFRNWWLMLRLSWAAERGRARRMALVLVLLVIPPLALLQALCFALDNILFPGLHRVEIKQPVFILGHARSGTTLLHRLLVSDPDRFSYFKAWEMAFPSLLSRRLLQSLATADRLFLGGRVGRAVLRGERGLVDPATGVHATGLRSPEEDDFVAALSCASGFWMVLFPFMAELDVYHVDRWPDRRRRRLLGYYRACLRRQLYAAGPGHVHCSKNPTFAGRVESLVEVFPDARFVVPLRDPAEAIPSLLRLIKGSLARAGWSREQRERSLRALTGISFASYRDPLAALDRHPDTLRSLVDYNELVASPLATVEKVYGELGMEITQEYRDWLGDGEQRVRGHEAVHDYSLQEFGLTPARLEEELGELYQRFGWVAPSADAPSEQPSE